MPIKADVLNTNITEMINCINFVHFDGPVIVFDGSSVLKSKSIDLNSASCITSIDSDKYYTIFTIEFGEQKFLTLKCKTNAYLKYIKHFRLTQTIPFEVKERISGLAIIAIGFGAIVFLSLLIGNGSTNSKTLTQDEEAKVCKAYIGELFGKPTSIIENYKNQDGLTYVRYTRKVDNTKWSYVCDLSGGSIAWAGWMSDTQEWGRWRYEDEAKLYYNESTNSISFVIGKNNSKVTVQL